MDEINIQVKYSIDGFNDALYFSFEEWENTTEKQLERLKNTRYQAYIEHINNPPVAPKKTKEELQLDRQRITDGIEEMQRHKQEIDSKIEELTK